MGELEVFNVTRNAVLAQKAKLAKTFNQRMKGLLGKSGLSPEEALILRPCTSIHTFFMRFPIDALFVDKNMRIVRLIQNLPPNRISPLVWASRMVIEIPAGKAGQTGTQIGDTVQIKA